MNRGALTCFACSTAAARQLLTSASLSAHLLRLACRSPRTASLSRSMACSSAAHSEDSLRDTWSQFEDSVHSPNIFELQLVDILWTWVA